MSGPTRREINRMLEELEEESLSAENRTVEDFPEILMQNLREHYDADLENTSTSTSISTRFAFGSGSASCPAWWSTS